MGCSFSRKKAFKKKILSLMRPGSRKQFGGGRSAPFRLLLQGLRLCNTSWAGSLDWWRHVEPRARIPVSLCQPRTFIGLRLWSQARARRLKTLRSGPRHAAMALRTGRCHRRLHPDTVLGIRVRLCFPNPWLLDRDSVSAKATDSQNSELSGHAKTSIAAKWLPPAPHALLACSSRLQRGKPGKTPKGRRSNLEHPSEAG